MTDPFDRGSAPGRQEYLGAALHRLLAEDTAVAELSIEVTCREGVVVLRGEVESAQRRDRIGRLVARRLPGHQVRNDISVARVGPPAEAEELP